MSDVPAAIPRKWYPSEGVELEPFDVVRYRIGGLTSRPVVLNDHDDVEWFVRFRGEDGRLAFEVLR